MYKTTWLTKLSCIIPEAIAVLIVTNITNGVASNYGLYLIYSVFLRLIWNSAIMIHGLGHTIAIALADGQLSVFNLTNVLEHQKVSNILKSLIPFQQIFIPHSPSLPVIPSPYLPIEQPNNIRLKACGGILLNLAIALLFLFCRDRTVGNILIAANLLIALTSLSDIGALVMGVADCLYCGNFGFIALRKSEDDNSLLPERMRQIALQMGRETEVRGEQAGGGLVMGKQGDSTVFVGNKIVNQKRSNLTESLETAFARERERAIAAGVEPMEYSTVGVWHYRYATSGTAPSKLETHWHQWMNAREEKVWQFTGREWICETKNVNHRITHNGDFDSWQIFNRQIDNATLGLWLERVLHTPNATKGDSPKIAGMIDLLVTQGMWYPSVRLAYQQAIATSIEAAFDGREPTADAPNTAPSQADLNTWAKIFERAFAIELSYLQQSDPHKIDPVSLKSSASLQQTLIRVLKNHNSTLNWSPWQIEIFVQFALETFFNNDLYRATQIFISRARGSFGLVTTSTLLESELVLSAKGQPITLGFNWQQGYLVYASEPAAVDCILLNQPQSFRLDLDAHNGEVAKVSAKDLTVYSVAYQQELTVLHLSDRWISMVDHPHLAYLKTSQTRNRTGQDLVAHDLEAVPQVLEEIKASWQNPTSLNRRSAHYLLSLLTDKVKRFEKKQSLMFKAGVISQIRTMPAIDLLITGEENSLWVGEKFAEELKIVFPYLNVVTRSANQILQQLDEGFGQLNLGKDSLVLAITQSGQTFSTGQVINICDRLSSQGIIGELFILTGELSSFLNATQGHGGLTTITPSSFLDREHNHRYRIFVNGSGRRTAEPSTVAVAAAIGTLTELLLYLAKQMRQDFSHSNPLGMTLTPESLAILAMMNEDFVSRNVPQIIGTTARGNSLKSTTKQTLVQNGRHWANHIIETPIAWAIHALYILTSVGWVIPFGHPLPLVKTLSESIFSLLNLSSSIEPISPLITLADIAVYIFGAWLWTLAIRYCQGRQLLARMGKRTLILGDVSWVARLLQSYVSKLFALSYGIATVEVHSADPQNQLLHAFGHRVVRGTLIWLGIPDGRRSSKQQAAENAVIMTGKQANGIKNLNIGAEIIALGQNPAIARQGFSRALVLDSNNDSIYFRSTSLEQKEQLEQLRESCFGSFERLLASYIFFWALAKKVASFPLLKYEYWKSQSRTKVMTTASPVGGIDLERLNKERSQQFSAIGSRGKN